MLEPAGAVPVPADTCTFSVRISAPPVCVYTVGSVTPTIAFATEIAYARSLVRFVEPAMPRTFRLPTALLDTRACQSIAYTPAGAVGGSEIAWIAVIDPDVKLPEVVRSPKTTTAVAARVAVVLTLLIDVVNEVRRLSIAEDAVEATVLKSAWSGVTGSVSLYRTMPLVSFVAITVSYHEKMASAVM